MSLYRKYRPQTFADVVGQDHIVTTLEQGAKQNKLAHAYLFAGSRGTGKTSVARILAKVLMIQGIQDEKLQHQIIKGVEEGTIVDLLEVDAASNTGVDNIRDLIEKIQFSPVIAGAKVYIIDEVHMLSKGAFNALLKTLEEPPPYAYFILATTELNKIPATIQSRCQCFPFRHIRDEDIVRRLQFISDTEKINIDREALRAIARHVEGGLRDAISLLDQLRSLPKIGVEEVEQRLGVSGHEYVGKILKAIEEKDTAAIIETVRTIEESGIPMDIFVRQLLGVVRDQLHEVVAAGSPHEGIVGVLDVLLQTIRDVRGAPVPALVVEAALLSLCDNQDAASAPKLSVKAAIAKKESEETPPEKLAKAPSEPVAEMKGAIVEAVDLSLSNIRENWPRIVEQVQPASVRMSLKDARVEELEGKKLILTFSSSFHRDKVAAVDASRAVEQIMENIFKRQLTLQCETERIKNNSAVGETVSLADAAAEIF